MAAIGLHHAAICTSDLDTSLRFWQDGMGLRQQFDISVTGSWRELFGAASDELRSVFLGDPANPALGIVELVVFAAAAPAAAPIDGRNVDMAVLTAPDGVLVELVGAPA